GGSVSFAVRIESEQAVVTVGDTGIGIEPDILPRVFDMFTQAERSLHRTRGGLGLGLALVKGLVELHGGSVLAASAGPGRGAESAVYLPLDENAATPADAPPEFGAVGQSFRILIIEDNRDAAETL